jgi:hypothetical protein
MFQHNIALRNGAVKQLAENWRFIAFVREF